MFSSVDRNGALSREIEYVLFRRGLPMMTDITGVPFSKWHYWVGLRVTVSVGLLRYLQKSRGHALSFDK